MDAIKLSERDWELIEAALNEYAIECAGLARDERIAAEHRREFAARRARLHALVDRIGAGLERAEEGD